MPFVLNDESQLNSYGFRTINDGIDLSRFNANPVMLDSHWGYGAGSVIGKWTNLRIEGSQLLADAEFDTEDDYAKSIKGKVDRGFVKGCSMGLVYKRENMVLQPDNTYTLIACELTEVSIVSIPSNKLAVKLYAETGKEISESEFKLSLQGGDDLPPSNQNQNQNQNPNMNKITLQVGTLLMLGLQNTEDPIALSAAIEGLAGKNKDLESKLSAEQTAHNAVKAELTGLKDAEATSLIEGAVTAGKITADQKEEFLSMAKSNLSMAKTVLGAIPEKANLAGQVIPGQKPGSFDNVKTDEDFQNLSHEQQLAFKAEQPEAFAKMFS